MFAFSCVACSYINKSPGSVALMIAPKNRQSVSEKYSLIDLKNDKTEYRSPLS